MTNEQALREEIEHLKGERDSAIKRAQVAEGERDSLAVYVEAGKNLIGARHPGYESYRWAHASPTASRARRDAEQQAMGMDSLIPMVADGIGRTLDLSEDQIIEVEEWLGGHAELRRQAEADQ